MWEETRFEEVGVAAGMDVRVRAIGEIVEGPKKLYDNICLWGVRVMRCYEGAFRVEFRHREAIELREGEVLVLYPHNFVTILATGKRNRLVYGDFDGAGAEAKFDEMGFFDCARGKTSSHYGSIQELKRMGEARKGVETVHAFRSYFENFLRTEAMEMRKSGEMMVWDAMRIIRRRGGERVVQLQGVCGELGVSRVAIYKAFMRSGLASPSEFIRREQLWYVRELLEETDLNLGEVAVRAGFLSASHFTRFVKMSTGMTPRQLREAGGGGCKLSDNQKMKPFAKR